MLQLFKSLQQYIVTISLLRNYSTIYRSLCCIDFNKAHLCCEAQRYTLSSEERKYYAKQYPQIAPGVRNVCETIIFK